AVANGSNLGNEALTIDGLGAAGQPGVLVNQSGDSFIGGDITTTSLGVNPQVQIASLGGTLTLDGDIDLGFARLTVTGDGNVRLNGNITGIGVDQVTAGGLNGNYYAVGAA